MDSSEIRINRHTALRKQIRKFLRVPFAVKQLAWRLTASWFWICALGIVFRFWWHLKIWEDKLFSGLNGTLLNFGFDPPNIRIFSICVKLLWLIAICEFSPLQIIGLFLYVPFLPLLIVKAVASKRLKMEPYRKTRIESLKTSRKSGFAVPKRTWGFPLFCLLLLWLVLYGQTSAPYPLSLALVLTALLFCSRVGKALTFAVPANNVTWYRIEGMSAAARKFLGATSENFKKGEIFDSRQLNLKIWMMTFYLRTFRLFSKWFYGKTARRRTALFVLLRFMINLAGLGGISIFFWALTIKFAMASSHVSLLDAILVSASFAIPGIPEPSALKAPASIQTLDTLMAWLVFVLYAGPVASLFPEFQKQAIEQSAQNYAKLRSERKIMYRVLEMFRQLRTLARENPELTTIAKAATQLSAHSEAQVREAFLSHPDTLKAWASRPLIVDFMRKLGAPIPNLEELVRELPQVVDGPVKITDENAKNDEAVPRP